MHSSSRPAQAQSPTKPLAPREQVQPVRGMKLNRLEHRSKDSNDDSFGLSSGRSHPWNASIPRSVKALCHSPERSVSRPFVPKRAVAA